MGYLTNWQARIALVRYVGDSSDQEVAQAVRQIQANESYDDVRYIIHDFTDCRSLTYSADCLAELAATDAAAALSKPAHTVLVITTRSDVLAMTEAYLASGFIPRDKLRLFGTLAEALATIA
jgi:hypothetical protein